MLVLFSIPFCSSCLLGSYIHILYIVPAIQLLRYCDGDIPTCSLKYFPKND